MVVPLTLKTGGREVSSLQLDLAFDPTRLSFEEVRIGASALSSGKELFAEAKPEEDTSQIRVLVVGLNRNVIGPGPLGFVIFRTLPGVEPARIQVREATGADPNGNTVSVVWLNEQTTETFVAFGRDVADQPKSVLFQGYFQENVDVYLRRIYVDDGTKHIVDSLLERSVPATATRNWNIGSVRPSERVLLLAARAGTDPSVSSNLLETRAIHFDSIRLEPGPRVDSVPERLRHSQR
jgi:hypothetical protein